MKGTGCFFHDNPAGYFGWHEYCNLVRKLGANLSERMGAGWIVCFFAAYWFGA